MSFKDIPQEGLSGDWNNELGDVMHIDPFGFSTNVADDGREVYNGPFKGYYVTNVGNTEHEKKNWMHGTIQLQDWVNPYGEIEPIALMTFSVQFVHVNDPKKPPSCACWSAEAIIKDGKIARIVTRYLIRRHSPSSPFENTTTTETVFHKI